MHTTEVCLLDGIFAADHSDLAVFQELFFSRAQLASTLRVSGMNELAEEVENENHNQFRQLVTSLPGNKMVRQALFGLTLHQGFSPEEAARLLEEHLQRACDGELY
jgi:hypothetical protein